jgi:hypothetical protein
MPVLARYIGIDYSGAETPEPERVAVYVASPPVEVMAPPSPRKYWLAATK